MTFSIDKSIEILQRTPDTLDAMLSNVSSEWTTANEGEGTWSVYDIVGHLIYGEKADWIPRMEIILSTKSDKHFPPFDRNAQLRKSRGKSLRDLLREFRGLRKKNVQFLRSRKLTTTHYSQTGFHPTFGEVTLSQLLAAWTVHDLDHLAQISRVMAKQYNVEVGPWTEFLTILRT
jgi:uncharacterized damage-inducible protein DinB